MRIARFTTGDNPQYAVVEGEAGEEKLHVVSGDPIYMEVRPTGAVHPIADVRLLAPVIPRSKIVCVGRNYVEHAAEFGWTMPEVPLLFFKPNTAVIGPGDPIVLPSYSNEVHFEAELAVVIGRLCKDVPIDRVDDVIYGYTVANDVTARDVQRTEEQWLRSKGFDTSCPLGPWIDTDFDPRDAAITTRLNGDLKQDDRTSAMAFDVPTLVAEITSILTLLPGDVILTGTPAGVGRIESGDRVECNVEGLGTLSNPVR